MATVGRAPCAARPSFFQQIKWRRRKIEIDGIDPKAISNKVETKQRRTTDRYLSIVDWCLHHRFLCGLLLVPAIVVASFFVLKKVPDNSPEAQDLQNLNIQYEFSENNHYAKIEHDYVQPVERFLLSN